MVDKIIKMLKENIIGGAVGGFIAYFMRATILGFINVEPLIGCSISSCVEPYPLTRLPVIILIGVGIFAGAYIQSKI